MGTMDGQIYGIPAVLQQVSAGGWTIEPTLLSTHQLKAEAFAGDFCEMDAVFLGGYMVPGYGDLFAAEDPLVSCLVYYGIVGAVSIGSVAGTFRRIKQGRM